MAAASAQAAPPIAHAIGGSLGSALALLLFYPLERARIELQSQVSSSSSPHGTCNTSNDNENFESRILMENKESLESVDVHISEAQTHETSPKSNISNPTSASSSSSWMPLEREDINNTEKVNTDKVDQDEEIAPSWSMNSSSTSFESASSQQHLSQEEKKKVDDSSNRVGLLRCLLRLHARNELYKGVTPVITTMVTSQFIFFYMHAYVKSVLQKTSYFSGRKRSLSLISSCTAGIINVLLTNPLWVVNMSIITGEAQSSSLWKELIHMMKAYGLRHLWNGTSASIMLVSNPVIQFFCYEQLKQARLTSIMAAAASAAKTTIHKSGAVKNNNNNNKGVTLPPLEAFVVGAMAKAVATVSTYPLQLAQTVLRLENNGYVGTLDCLIQLYRRNGIPEWFTGMKAKLLQTVLTAAFTFLTYEQILGAVQVALLKGPRVP